MVVHQVFRHNKREPLVALTFHLRDPRLARY